MIDQDDRPFSDEDAARLRAHPEPPPALEDRVVTALGRQAAGAGLADRGKRRTRLIAAAACGLLAFALGRWTVPSQPMDRGTFLLLIQEAPGAERMTADERTRRVAELTEWARDLRGRGLLASAEKLEDGGTVLSAEVEAPLTTADRTIGGFFVIRAATVEDATSIARGSPHLRNGGRIVLRRFDRGR